MEGDAHVGRDGPGRGGPDEAVDAAAGQRRVDGVGLRSQLEAHPDGRAGMVLVLHLGFRQRGAVGEAPVHGLEPFVDVAPVDEFDEGARDGGFVVGRERQVGLIPAAEDPQAAELRALNADPLHGVLAALFADLRDRHLGFFGAEFLIHLVLDGQTVAIPSGHVGRVEAGHAFRLDDEVLEHLVERRAGVDAVVGEGRAVVQDELGAAGAGLADAFVELGFFPTSQDFRLGLRQVRLHRKIGVRQVDRLFEVESVLWHWGNYHYRGFAAERMTKRTHKACGFNGALGSFDGARCRDRVSCGVRLRAKFTARRVGREGQKRGSGGEWWEKKFGWGVTGDGGGGAKRTFDQLCTCRESLTSSWFG